MSPADFIEAFSFIQMQAHQISIRNGWWDKPVHDATALALVHCEVSEVVEALRNGNGPSDKIPSYTKAEEELADIILRVMDFAQSKNLQVAGALIAKMDHNRGREYRHGKKF